MKTSPSSHTVTFGKRKIDFVLARSDRKRLRIVVEPDLAVRVTAPMEATDKEVLAGVEEKAAWISRNLELMRDYHPRSAPFPAACPTGSNAKPPSTRSLFHAPDEDLWYFSGTSSGQTVTSEANWNHLDGF